MQSGKLWLDSLSRSNWFLRHQPAFVLRLLTFSNTFKSYLASVAAKDLEPVSKKLADAYQLNITRITPLLKDRGLLIDVSYNPNSTETALKDIVSTIRKEFQGQFRAFAVKGSPFVEDLTMRRLSNRLRVEFHGPDPSLDRLFAELRPYGRLFDINYFVNKDGPRYAIANFVTFSGASSAKMCLNGHVVDGTRLVTEYEAGVTGLSVVKKWITEHPRISVPLFATSVAALSYSIFDPVRVFFIYNNLTERFQFPAIINRFVFVGNLARDSLSKWIPWGQSDHAQASTEIAKDFAGREEVKQKIIKWIDEKPNTVLLVMGPRGYGKTSLVRSVTDNKAKNRIVISCDDIVNRSEHEMLARLASQVGYFPLLSFTRVSKIADTLVAATLGGQKPGFSSTSGSELRKVLQLVTVALTEVTQRQKKDIKAFKPLSDDQDIVKEGSEGRVALETEISFPVVVITNFMDTDAQQFSAEVQQHNTEFYETLTEWAMFLTQNQIAHVVLVSSGGNQGGGGQLNKMITKILPARAIDTVVFSNASKSDALQYLNERFMLLQMELHEKESLNEAVDVLGGNLTDLESLLGKMKTGTSITASLDDMVSRAANHLRQIGETSSDWSIIQFWYLVRELSKSQELKFEVVKHSTVFNGDSSVLLAMERAEVISVHYVNGQPIVIHPGKPLYFAAMKRIVNDTDLYSKSLDMRLYRWLADKETAKAKELETEIMQIIEAMKTTHLDIPRTVVSPDARSTGWLWSSEQHPLIARYHFLGTQLQESQTKIEKYWAAYMQCKSAIK